VAAGLVSALGLSELSNPLPGVSSYHAALLGARQAGSLVDLSLLGWLGLRDEAAVRRYIDGKIPWPANKLIQEREIAGVRVKEISVGAAGLNGAVSWAIGGGSVRFAIGAQVMERLLEDRSGGGAPERRVLAAFLLQPDRIPDLGPARDLLVSLGAPAELATGVVTAVSAFRRAGLEATLADGGVRVAGGFALR
jgi:hypothetical protein